MSASGERDPALRPRLSLPSSLEQALRHVAARRDARRHGEHRRRGVLDVLVQRVAGSEAALDLDELLERVALEADEEQARVELAELRVHAVGEGVAPAQDLLAAVGLRRGEADVGVDRDPGLAAVALAVKSASSNSVWPPIGAPEVFSRPMVSCWSARLARGSQTSISIRIRRVTMNVPSRIHAGSSPAPSQTCRRIAAVSSARMLLVPSLKPMRLRGVACARLVVEVRPNPSWDQRITTLPRPMRARLRTAWKATWGRRRTPARRGPRPSARARARRRGRRGRSRSSARPLRPQAEAVLAVAFEQGRAQAEGDRELGRSQVERLPGVGRRGGAHVVGNAGHPARAHLRGGRGPVAQQLAHVLGSVHRQVERGDVQAVLGRGGDAGLVAAVERDRVLADALALVVGRRRGRVRSRPRRRPRRSAGGEQLAPGQPRSGHAPYATMREGTRESAPPARRSPG